MKKWNELTANDINNIDKKSSVAVINISSCEQHAKHLPLGTDGYIGRALVESISNKSNKEIYLLSNLDFGFSEHHMNFPGTISLKQNTLVNAIIDIVTSVSKSGFVNFLILNSHGGNFPSIQFAVNEIGEILPQLNLIALKYWDFISEEIKGIRDSDMGGIGHAGELETSLMLFLKPELVNLEECKFDYPVYRGNEWFNPDMFASNLFYQYKTFDYYSKLGNIGEPKFATQDKGEVIFNLITDKLAYFMNEYFK